MTAAPSLPERADWTVDDLATLPSDVPYELINGRLAVPSQTALPQEALPQEALPQEALPQEALPQEALHRDLCMAVVAALRASCPRKHAVSYDRSLRVDLRNQPRPDVIATRIQPVDGSPVPVDAVMLAVEIVSPASASRDMVEKGKIYAAAMIPIYWVIDASRGDRVSLAELVLEPKRARYGIGRFTRDIFTSEAPWPVTLDLPTLSARRAAVVRQARVE